MTSSKRNKTAHPLNASTPVISSRVLHKVNLDQQAIAAAKAKDLADYQQANSAHAPDHTPSVLAAVKQPRLNSDTPPSHDQDTAMMASPQDAIQTALPSDPVGTDEGVLAQQDEQAVAQCLTQPTDTAIDTPPHVQLDLAQPVDNGAQTQQQPQAECQIEPDQTVMIAEPVLTWCATTGQWSALAEAVVGLSHRDHSMGLPCQDAALANQTGRPVLVVCDGAGSAAVSELGAQAMTVGLHRLVDTLEMQLAPLLDDVNNQITSDDEQGRQMVRQLLRHAKGLLQDLSQQHRRDIRDFRATLLLAVVGRERCLWLRVGDGAMVIEHIEQATTYDEQDQPCHRLRPVLCCLGTQGKGEFANQTTFVDAALTMQDVQWGLMPIAGISGIAAMTDGAAEKLVSNDGLRVAGLMSQWFDDLRQQRLRRRDLTQAFYTEKFIKGSTGDDRGIALLANQVIYP